MKNSIHPYTVIALLGMFLVGAIVVLELRFMPSPQRDPITLLSLGLGAVMILAVATLAQARPKALLVGVMAAVLDAGGILSGALLVAGLDGAVLLPFLAAVVLLAFRTGRRLRLGFALSWTCGVAGVAAAFTVGGLTRVASLESVPVSVAASAVMTGFAYALLWWVGARWRESIAAGENAASVALAAARRSLAAAEEANGASLRAMASEHRLLALVTSSPLPTFALDPTGVVHAWNPAAERALGWSADELLGRALPSIVAAAQADAADSGPRPFTSGKVISGDRMRLRRKDGSEIEADVYGASEREQEDVSVGVVVQFVDVTEREATEARLLESQRFEALGQLAGGIAHDFNNSLTAIGGFATLILNEAGDGAIRDDARVIVESVNRASHLTHQLLAYSRTSILLPEPIDPGAFVRSMLPLVKRLVGEDLEIIVESTVDDVTIEVDPGQLQQALLNLVVNASDAMAAHGRVVIRLTGPMNAPDSGWHELESGSWVLLSVVDTGEGIPAEHLERVAEPFFTTKPAGKGTGLGLAMVQGFVSQSHGRLMVRSREGSGTTVVMAFPVADSKCLDSAGVPDSCRGGDEVIFFVEDEPVVAAFGVRALRELGYTVVPARNSEEALHMAGKTEWIDLLVSDVAMPGMRGPDLALELERRHPEMKTLLVTGYSSPQGAGSLAEAELLLKPFTRAQLACRVREVLDGAEDCEDAS